MDERDVGVIARGQTPPRSERNRGASKRCVLPRLIEIARDIDGRQRDRWGSNLRSRRFSVFASSRRKVSTGWANYPHAVE